MPNEWLSSDTRSSVDTRHHRRDDDAPASGPLLVIVGFPGPGVSLLGEWLNRHADLAICPGFDWILKFYETWTGLNHQGVITPGLMNKWVALGRFDPHGIGRDSVNGLFEDEAMIPFKALLDRLFARYRKIQGKRFVGSDGRGSRRDLAELHSLWPEARFVHVVEDGRGIRHDMTSDPDLFQALRNLDTWGDAPVSTLAHVWASSVQKRRESGRALGPGLYHEIRYEDLQERPDHEIARLLAFLDLDQETHEPWSPGAASSSDWRTEMAAGDLELFEAAAGEVLVELGYPRAVPRPRTEAIRLADAARDAFDKVDPARRRAAFQIGRYSDPPSTNPFVFLVGCPRSGTTMLQRILDAHPEVAICPETFWLPYYFKNRIGLAADGTVTGELRRRLLHYHKFYRMKIGPDVLESAMTTGGPTSYSAFVSRVFDHYGQGRGKPLVGDKTPDYVRNLPTLHALWPEAKFVHLIRDGRDVCLSAIHWKRKAERFRALFSTWGADPVSTAALWWEWHVRHGREAGQALGPGRYHEIRYESLVENPDEESERLCLFLGLSYDPRMLRYHEKRVINGTGLDAKGAWLPITAGLRDWRSQMPVADVERFEAATGDLLEELGYPLPLPQPGPDASHHAALIREVFERDSKSLGDWLP